MSKINVLSFEIANLIAAGEVVERPSSVLKELIENSIDSGATKIVAEIKRGGVALIRVTDNGCGMEKEDLPNSLKRHATSKIREKGDLDSIMTLGFRGEALAAISSVSNMTIISKTKEAPIAHMLVAEAGNIVDFSEVGASDGTTVVVENLFGNVPARRKFLKKDATEAMNVAALVEKIALSRPDISIQLLIDGEERFKTPGNSDLFATIRAIFGKDFSEKLIKADGVANGITVHGYVGRSDNVRKNRNLQNVFINGRYVKSLTAMAAIEKAYTSYIAPECFPVCVLFIELHPSLVDVNVHPAKLEVKFSDERPVFETVYYTIKTALENHEYRPELKLAQGKKEYNALGAFVAIGEETKGDQLRFQLPTERSAEAKREVPRDISHRAADIDRPLKVSSGFGAETRPSVTRDVPRETMTPRDSLELLERYRDAAPKEEPLASRAKADMAPEGVPTPEQEISYKLIGEAFDCYVMVEFEGALLIIDKHAAHERVIFEDLKRISLSNGKISTQTLLLPMTLSLTPEELSAAEEFSDELRATGFSYNINCEAVDIIEIPNAIGTADAESLFVKMLDELVEGRGNPETTEAIRKEKALYQVACKAAIKGGRVYDRALIDWLVRKILLLPDITVCPHGRPIAYRLTKNELDRQFERIK